MVMDGYEVGRKRIKVKGEDSCIQSGKEKCIEKWPEGFCRCLTKVAKNIEG